MNSLARNTVKVGIVSAAGILLAGSAAHAAGQNWSTSQNSGIGNGIQAYAPIQIPVNVCGNAIGLIGSANAGCTGGASALYEAGAVEQNWNSGFNFGIANGDQVQAIVQVPVDVCGNAISLLGSASAWCQGGSKAIIGDEEPPVPGPAPYGHSMRKPAAHHAADRPAAKPAAVKHGHHYKHKIESLPLVGDGLTGITDGVRSVLTGTFAQSSVLPIDAFIDGEPVASRHGGDHCSLNWFTSNNSGLLNGVQAFIPVQAPVDVSGNAVGVIGDASAYSVGGARAQFC